MFVPDRVPPEALRLVDRVVEVLTRQSGVSGDDLMLVGAHCRDVLERGLGLDPSGLTTHDVDLGLVVANWATFDTLVAGLQPVRDSANGINYRVAGVPIDLMPFGEVEEPAGEVTPPRRREPMSVFGFGAVFDSALLLPLPCGITVRIPSVPGFTALKVAAWLDRSPQGNTKDGSDLGRVMSWYDVVSEQSEWFYVSPGLEIWQRYDFDGALGAAYRLGNETAQLLGSALMGQVAERWGELQAKELARAVMSTRLPAVAAFSRGEDLVRAFSTGMGLSDPFTEVV